MSYLFTLVTQRQRMKMTEKWSVDLFQLIFSQVKNYFPEWMIKVEGFILLLTLQKFLGAGHMLYNVFISSLSIWSRQMLGELLRSPHDGGTSGHAEFLATILAEQRQHLASAKSSKKK